MKLLIIIYFTVILLVSTCLPVSGFDNDRDLDLPDFNRENFIDIHSYQFSKIREDAWYAAENGWRATGGSLSLDLLYVDTQLKLRRNISENFSIGISASHEVFYSEKPIAPVTGELEFHLLPWLGFSVMGRPGYEKQDDDLGYAMTLGQNPWNYLKLSRMEEDVYYNEKNIRDASFYKQIPVVRQAEGAWHLSSGFRGRFELIEQQKLIQIFPEENLYFEYEGIEYSGMLDHPLTDATMVGMSFRTFAFQKYRLPLNESDIQEDHDQSVQYVSYDIYAYTVRGTAHHLTSGVRWDRFVNDVHDRLNERMNYDYKLETLQAYGVFRQQITPQKALEYGLFAGDAEELTEWHVQHFRKDSHGIEAKLRVSLELLSPSAQDVIMFSTTWNLDELLTDFWDGGHLSFQTVF
ncbi:MAG: hypothetical protein HQM12_00595 [SAR324 cluster bacterium]|nr:hypothetical protein [SAR324 cluster bacterium]